MIPRVWSDSSGCRRIVRRTGSGSLTWRSDTRGHRNGCREGEFLLKSVPTDDNVADLMTKHLAAARVEELFSKLGVRRCTRGACGRILDYESAEAHHFDARADHVATVSLAHEVMLLVVECVVLCWHWLCWQLLVPYCCWHRCCRDTATPRVPGGPCRGTKASVRPPS